MVVMSDADEPEEPAEGGDDIAAAKAPADDQSPATPVRTPARSRVPRTLVADIARDSPHLASLAAEHLDTARRLAAAMDGPLAAARQMAPQRSAVVEAARWAARQQAWLSQLTDTWSLAHRALRDRTQLTALTEQLTQTGRDWAALTESWSNSSVLGLVRSPGFAEQLQRVRERTRKYLPSNWPEELDWSAVWTVAVQEGFALVWVPRADIVTELLQAADHDGRWAVLAERASDIADDCAAVATTVTAEPLAQYRARVEEVIAAHRAGVPAAAQALAAVVFTALIQSVYVGGKLNNLPKSPLRARDLDDVDLAGLKAALLVEASIPAVAAIGDLVPTEQWPAQFNRHLTLHRVADEQYTAGNAVAALMLATALLAEAQQLLADGRLPAVAELDLSSVREPVPAPSADASVTDRTDAQAPPAATG
jgi:hypothetical protein